MAELTDLSYISRLKADDLYEFWKKSFRVDKNGDNRSSIRKVWLFTIAKLYTDIKVEDISQAFNTKRDTIVSNRKEYVRRKGINTSEIDNTMKELNYWKYKKMK